MAGNGAKSGMPLPLPSTEMQVTEAAVARQWDRVTEAMVGKEHRVHLAPHSQNIVLEEALRSEAYDFIAGVVHGEHPFGPDTLDKALHFAVEARNLPFLEKVVLSRNSYQFDHDLLLQAMQLFCMDDDWVEQAYRLAQRLPDDLNAVKMDQMVYIPLMSRPTEKYVQVKNILNLLRNRYQPDKNDSDSD